MTGTCEPTPIDRGRLLGALKQRRGSGPTGGGGEELPDAALMRSAIWEFDRLIAKGILAEMIYQELVLAERSGHPENALDMLCMRLYGLTAAEIRAVVHEESGGSGLMLPRQPRGYDDD